MNYIVVKPIPTEELKEHADYIGFLFKNENGVYNICDTLEDIVKSNQWFNNRPVHSIIVSDDPIKIGDKILVTCANQEMNGKTFTYNGEHSEGLDLVNLTNKRGDIDKEVISTKFILDGAYKVLRPTTREDKEKLVNGIISPIVK